MKPIPNTRLQWNILRDPLEISTHNNIARDLRIRINENVEIFAPTPIGYAKRLIMKKLSDD